MYKVSEAYKKAISQNVRHFKIRAEFTFLNAPKKMFDDDTIKGDPMIESQVVSGSSSCGMIDLGAAISARITLNVIDEGATVRKYKDASFTLIVYLQLENGEYEPVPMGTFYCDTKKMTRVGNLISVVAYDAMSTLNYVLTEEQKNRLKNTYVFQATKILIENGKCNFNQTVANFANYNGYYDFSSTQIVTARDGVMWLAQIMGCCARISRDGYLEYVPIKLAWDYTNNDVAPVKVIDHLERYSTTFSDDKIQFVGVSMLDANNNLITRSIDGLDGESKLTIAMEKNPIIRPTDDLAYKLDNIVNRLNTTYFSAFSAEIISDPALEAGDTVRLIGGQINVTENNELIGFITHNIWRYRGKHEIINTGQAPTETADGVTVEVPRSQTDKVTSSLVKQTNDLNEQVQGILNVINSGSDRAKYIQTYDDTTNNPATKLQTLNSQVSGYTGNVGYIAGENLAKLGCLKSSYTYNSSNTTARKIHSVDEIIYNLVIEPYNSLVLNSMPDKINLQIYGSAPIPGTNNYKYGITMQARLTFSGYWTTNEQSGSPERDLIYVRYMNQKSITSFESVGVVQEFELAGIRFEAHDDGLYIIRKSYAPAYPEYKYVIIPWNSTATAAAAQTETVTTVQAAVAKPTKTDKGDWYCADDGIHITYNGHSKVIPWDD